jgi:HK97 gp10 family phage protein
MPEDFGGGTKIVVVSNKFPAISNAIPDKVDRVVRKAAFDIEAGAKDRAPVDLGTLKNSIQAGPVAKGHWRVRVGVHYGIYQEFGTSRMPAQPYLMPAFEAVVKSFRRAIAGAIKEAAS